jgi:putative ABC transport system substrate-binding protein
MPRNWPASSWNSSRKRFRTSPASPSSETLPRQAGTSRKARSTCPRELNLEVNDFPVSRPEDLASTFGAMKRKKIDAILVRRDVLVIERRRAEVVALAAQQQLPAIYSFREFPDSGGLMSYGVNVYEIHRRSATFVDKILKGAKPGDLPIEQPTKFELVINLKAARALKLTIPATLLMRADQAIDR